MRFTGRLIGQSAGRIAGRSSKTTKSSPIDARLLPPGSECQQNNHLSNRGATYTYLRTSCGVVRDRIAARPKEEKLELPNKLQECWCLAGWGEWRLWAQQKLPWCCSTLYISAINTLSLEVNKAQFIVPYPNKSAILALPQYPTTKPKPNLPNGPLEHPPPQRDHPRDPQLLRR